jgi:DNA-directed RNA polymerase specialized sigma24 family protein
VDDMESLLEAQIPGLRRYAWALLRDHDAADDLVHDTLERAIEGWPARRPNGEMRGWLYRIQRQLYLSGQRYRLGGEAPPAGKLAAGGSLMQDVAGELAQLSEIERSALLLVGVEGLSYEETAGVLEMPVAAVMGHLGNARTRMRSAIRTDGAAYPRRVK